MILFKTLTSKCCDELLGSVEMPKSHAESYKIVCSKCNKFVRWGINLKHPDEPPVKYYMNNISIALEKFTCGREYDFLMDLWNRLENGTLKSLTLEQHALLNKLSQL